MPSLFSGFEMIMIIILLISIILGVVLISVSVGFISKKANNPSILINYIIFAVLWILGIFLISIFLTLNYYYGFIDEIIISEGYLNFGGLAFIMITFISDFILIFAAFKINKSYENITWYTKNKLFNITGKLFIISAFVIWFVGLYNNIININDAVATQTFGYISYIVLLIVCILQIIAFSFLLSSNSDFPTKI